MDATDEMADGLMAAVCATWGIEPANLPRLLDALAAQLDDVGRQPLLLMLYVCTRLLTIPAGCELLVIAGCLAARGLGAPPALVEQLRAHVRPPKRERGH